MKKIISIMLALILNLNIAFGYMSTIIMKGVRIKVSAEEGSIVNIESKIPEAVGWEVKTNNTTVENGEFIMPAADVVIEAIIADTATYLLKVGNQYFYRKESKPAGEIVTIEAANTDGSYIFSNWTAEGIELTESQKVSQAITITMPANDVTILANYIEAGQEYTVAFNANGGSGTMAPQTFIVGTPQNLNLNTFTNSGKTFAGWSTNPSATTNQYTDGQSYSGTENITLYAVWTTDAYTITYNLDGGTVTGNPGTYNVDTETITLINPTKEGYTFKGWTGSNGSTPSTNVTIPKGSTGNKTYTANWETTSYTITYNLDGGTVTGNPSTYNVTTNTITLSNPSKTGYTFTGWTGSNGNTPSTTVTIPVGSTGNKTYTANWELQALSAEDISAGDIVKLSENGTLVEYIVVHIGNPDTTIYNGSCDGIWLLRKDLHEASRVWGDYGVAIDYAESSIHSYLNSTFLDLFDENMQSAIKQVKIPYCTGSSFTYSVVSGDNGLSAKIFLLSLRELGFYNTTYIASDEGAELAYFSGCAESSEDSKRIAYFEGATRGWWSRSRVPDYRYDSHAGNVNQQGNMSIFVVNAVDAGVRPALILPMNSLFDLDTNEFIGVN